MATFDWPGGPGFVPETTRFGVDAPMSSWSAAYTGQRQSLSNQADRLTVAARLPHSSKAPTKGRREALIFGLKSSGDLVRLPRWDRPVPLGTLRGVPTLSADALTGARSVAITGATAGANLYVATEAFNAAAWTKNNVTVHADTFGDAVGGTTADVVEVNSVTGAFFTHQALPALTTNGTYTVSVYAFSDSSRLAIEITPKSGVQGYAYFNVGTGSGAVLSASAGLTAAISAAPGGLWRCSVTFNAGSGVSTPSVVFFLANLALSLSYAGAGQNMALWGAQFELGALSAYSGLPTLLAGDIIAVGNQLLPVGYAGAVLNAGAGTVPLSIIVRDELSNGATVLWDRPRGVFQLVSVDPELEYQPGDVQVGPELHFVEVI